MIAAYQKVAKRLLIVSCCCIMTHCSFCQERALKKDTVYIIICYGTLENGRPVVTQIAQKDLSFFKTTHSNDQDAFMCQVFSHSIFYLDDGNTYLKNYRLDNPPSKKPDSLYYAYNKALRSLAKSFKDFKGPKFLNGKRVIFSVSKIAGEFWLVRTDPHYLYPVSESFFIDPGCYNYNYLYNLKQIDAILKLNSEDIKILSAISHL